MVIAGIIGGAVFAVGLGLLVLPGASVTYEAVTDLNEYERRAAERANPDWSTRNDLPIQTEQLVGTCGSPAQEFWFPASRDQPFPQDAPLRSQMAFERQREEDRACSVAAPPRLAVPLLLMSAAVVGTFFAVRVLSSKRETIGQPRDDHSPTERDVAEVADRGPAGQQPPDGYWWDGNRWNPPGEHPRPH